jgi:hypothetical protein
MSRRVDQLDRANWEMKRRTLLAAGLNVVLLLALVGWLAWPGKGMISRTLTVSTLDAESIVTPHAALREDGLLILSDQEPSSVHLSAANPDAPSLTLQHDENGRIVASVGNAPFIGLYADGRSTDSGSGPQIEMALDDRDASPRIVLRDVRGQVIWHAP